MYSCHNGSFCWVLTLLLEAHDTYPGTDPSVGCWHFFWKPKERGSERILLLGVDTSFGSPRNLAQNGSFCWVLTLLLEAQGTWLRTDPSVGCWHFFWKPKELGSERILLLCVDTSFGSPRNLAQNGSFSWVLTLLLEAQGTWLRTDPSVQLFSINWHRIIIFERILLLCMISWSSGDILLTDLFVGFAQCLAVVNLTITCRAPNIFNVKYSALYLPYDITWLSKA